MFTLQTVATDKAEQINQLTEACYLHSLHNRTDIYFNV